MVFAFYFLAGGVYSGVLDWSGSAFDMIPLVCGQGGPCVH